MRILVVKLSSLGDILHVLPTVQVLKEELHAEIDWCVHPEFAQIVETFADVSHIITYPRHNLLRELPEAVRHLREVEYDLVVDLHGLFKSGLASFFARGKRKIAPSYARECSSIFFGERAGAFDRTRHAVEQAYDTLRYLNLPVPKVAQMAHLRPVPKGELVEGIDEKTIVFAPRTRWETKNWPIEHFASLANMILLEYPKYKIVVIGGKGDIAIGEEIAKSDERIVNLAGKTSIASSMNLLSRARLLVACDTGPVHMAAAVGTQCVVIFGPTRADWTGPFGEGHRIVSLSLPCQPCLKRVCAVEGFPCMRMLSPNLVFDAVREILR